MHVWSINLTLRQICIVIFEATQQHMGGNFAKSPLSNIGGSNLVKEHLRMENQSQPVTEPIG